MKNKFLTLAFFAAILLGGGYLFAVIMKGEETSTISAPQIQLPVAPSNSEVQEEEAGQPSQPVPETANVIGKEINLDVPFTVQAPYKNWSDPVFQNACEEASIVMAMGWINGIKFFLPAEAQKQIKDIVDFENTAFGYNTDTDVFDIQKIFQDFFRHQNVSVRENITSADIKSELQNGNLIIVPVFGQALGNPNFTVPGPVAHMLVITGYSPATKEFITNDPGTKRGEGYRYGEDVLFDAIWAYQSGKDAPSPPGGTLKKMMLVARK